VTDTVNVVFNALPDISLPENAGPCATEDLILTAGEDDAYMYQWYSGTTLLEEETAGSYQVLSDGSYSVVATNAAGCDIRATTEVNFIIAADIVLDETLDFCAGAFGTVESMTEATAGT